MITGAAGFIGHHLAHRYLQSGHEVLSIDELNDYYDPELKKARLKRLALHATFSSEQFSIVDRERLLRTTEKFKPDLIFNLAGQVGVRNSIHHPHEYVSSNVVGFLNVLECARLFTPKHLFYASSSSVYGNNEKTPFSETDRTDHPLSLYAATKKSNELMAYAYSHLHSIPTTGLRFFTVYGPWGRPDMMLFKFTRAILADEEVEVYHHGKHLRDFTYIDDVVECMVKLAAAEGSTQDLYRIFNVGNEQPILLEKVIECLEAELGKVAKKKQLPMQAGDMISTASDTSALRAAIHDQPQTPITDGIRHFVKWYLEYYSANK